MTTGQIQAPSAFELWWEKKRKAITTVCTLIVVGVLAYYGWQFLRRSKLDATWSEFAAQAGLRAGYGEPGDMLQLVQQNPQYFDFGSVYLRSIPETLVNKLGEHVGRIDDKAFDDAIAAAAGTERAPLLMWLAANRAIGSRSFERAKSLLRQLQEKHPHHFLCLKSEHPAQYRRDLNEPEPGAQTDGKPHTPQLADAVPGSVLSLALARIEREEKFAAEHATLYTAPEPDSKTVALVKTDFGEFKIGFFEAAAPKHVQTFTTLVKEQKFFDKMAVDQIRRAGDTPSFSSSPVEEMHFGLFATIEQQDRAEWDKERNNLDDKHITAIEFEDSRLSHFPMMVAASPGKDGKSIVSRIWINVNEASAEHDGKRVIFGKVIAGQDVVRRLVLDPVFSREDERRSGRGTPRDTIRIQSITIE